MRIKALLTSILLASTTIAGVASAAPSVRDHRTPAPVTYKAPVRYQNQTRVQPRPSWMVNASANVNYGFQVAANGSVQPYTYGNDPHVEGIARGEWFSLASGIRFDGNQNHGAVMNLEGREMSAVELQSISGCSQIAKVVVTYSNGQEMALKPGRQLDAHTPNLRIDLGGKGRTGISRVIVYGTGDGVFRVLGA